MAKIKKGKKERPNKYEKPFVINGVFEQVIKVAVGKADEVKKEIDEEKEKDIKAKN